MNKCPDKASLDRYKYTSETGRENFFRDLDRPKFHTPVESEENWDDVRLSIQLFYILYNYFFRLIAPLMILKNMQHHQMFYELKL